MLKETAVSAPHDDSTCRAVQKVTDPRAEEMVTLPIVTAIMSRRGKRSVNTMLLHRESPPDRSPERHQPLQRRNGRNRQQGEEEEF